MIFFQEFLFLFLRMRGVIVLAAILATVSSIPVDVDTGVSNDRYGRHGDADHTHKPATEEELQLSMEEIAAQLISDPLTAKDNVASNTPPEGIEAITEGQAKVVVDHIKGLLSDIYTNSVVDGEIQEEEKTEKPEYLDVVKNNEEKQGDKKEPTILELFSHLDQNTVHDKESLLSIIQDFTTDSPVTDDGKSTTTTPNLFIFQDLDTTTTEATTTTTTTTTAAEPVTRAVTTTTTTTTTTTESTTTTSTTPRPQPTPPTLLKLVDQSFGGIFSGLGNVASTILTGRPFFAEGIEGQASNSWLPFGRKKRDVTDNAAVRSMENERYAREKVSAHQIFQKFREE